MYKCYSLCVYICTATRHAQAIYVDSKFRHSLRHYGVVHIPNAISMPSIHAALKLFNKEIGMLEFAAVGSPHRSNRDGDKQPEVLDLFNKSFLRHLFERLLGPRDDNYEVTVGQLFPRFPDELCPNGADWHIDFSDAQAVKQSGYEVLNFDALVLVTLTDSHGIDSGELCTFPSSHQTLSKYYTANPHMFENLHQFGGIKGYPPEYQDVIGDKAYHCLGKAGDVFILNYMNAHYGNCNSSPYIRNAVYFRVWGSTYPSYCMNGNMGKISENTKKSPCANRTSMLDPLVHWRI